MKRYFARQERLMFRQGILKTQRLSQAQRAEVEALAGLCRQQDGLELPLYLEAAPPDQIGQMLYYRQDELIGFAGLDDHIEVTGAVHPAHRRQGVGRTLLTAVRQACLQRGAGQFLLVCEAASSSGQAFAEAVGADYRFSEYLMAVEQTTFNQLQRPQKTIALQPANERDLDQLVAMRVASHNDQEAAVRQTIARWLEQENQRLYLGRRGGEAVGMLRLHLDRPNVFINSFTVRPEYRRRGYGRQMLLAVVSQLIAEDWPHIMLEVATDNRNALSLYHTCGFREVAIYRYYHLPV